MLIRILLFIFLVPLFSACGGGDNDNHSGQDPSAQLLTLNYPFDFPSLQTASATLPKAFVVNGLSARTAYTFSLTSNSAELNIMVMDYTSQGQGGPVCFSSSGENSCNGTTSNVPVLVTVGNFSGAAQTFTFTITPSNTQSTLNEGTVVSPKVLTYSGSFSYNGSVAALGNSYYRINNLMPNARYVLSVTSAEADELDLYAFADMFVSDLRCDPNHSASLHCVFVSDDDTIGVHIAAPFAFTGILFTVELVEVSAANDFEGLWYTPYDLDLASSALDHLGHTDIYSSYYRVTGLEIGRTYTMEITSKSVPVTFGYYDSATGNRVGGQCDPDTRTNNYNEDGGCTFVATGSEKHIIAYNNSNALDNGRYIIKVTAEPVSEGSIASPVSLQMDSGFLHFDAQVDTTASYYHVSNMPIGTPVMIRVAAGATGQNPITVYDGDATYTTAVTCSPSYYVYCVFTPAANDTYIKVAGAPTLPGHRFTLNATPVPVNESSEVAITAAQLPYRGRVGDYFSTYIVTGLDPDTLYLATMTNPVGSFSFSAWDSESSVIECMVGTDPHAACLVQTSQSGAIKMRGGANKTDNADPGGYFTLNIEPAPQLTMAFQSADTPLAIPDNYATGITSTINVTGSAIASIQNMVVEVLVDHGYISDVVMTLIAPDGQQIPLVANASVYGDGYLNTRFNDYARRLISTATTSFYNTAYRPATPLYHLNDLPADGSWQLQVADDRYTNISSALGGTLLKWGIQFE